MFFIEITNKSKQQGYPVDLPTGLAISNKFTGQVKLFDNASGAHRFAKRNSLHVNGCRYLVKKVTIWDAAVIESANRTNRTIYCVEVFERSNEAHRVGYLHYNTKTEQYFLNPSDIGACCWHDTPTVEAFVKQLEIDDKNEQFILKVGEFKTENTEEI